MTDDLKIGLDDFESEFTGSKTLEKVERAYDEYRDSSDLDFDSQDDLSFDISVDDFWGL